MAGRTQTGYDRGARRPAANARAGASMFATLLQQLPTGTFAGPARAMLGTWEIIAILAVVVLLFGAAKLPQLGKGLGEAIGNFKRAQKEGEREAMRTEIDATPRIESQNNDRLGQDPKA